MRKVFLIFLSFLVVTRLIIPSFDIFLAKQVINLKFKADIKNNMFDYNVAENSEYEDFRVMETFAENAMVYVGGVPIGISLNSKGIIVIGKTDVITEFGLKSTVKNSDIQNGDIITEIEGAVINSADDLSRVINEEKNKGKRLSVLLTRGKNQIDTIIEPQLDASTKKYKAGLWIREETFGIGTLTFIRQNDRRFGALGHPVSDPDTGEILEIRSGAASECNITGIIKGERGRAGELKGVIAKSDTVGLIDKNNMFGIFGTHSKTYSNPLYPHPIPVMNKKDIKPGKAKILSTIDGTMPKEYDIEIIKSFNQNKPTDKNLVIRVTDKELLASTGGIVQGMSGSPILQNGKFCGAVTHVFINDPTKGYGVFADWMLQQ